MDIWEVWRTGLPCWQFIELHLIRFKSVPLMHKLVQVHSPEKTSISPTSRRLFCCFCLESACSTFTAGLWSLLTCWLDLVSWWGEDGSWECPAPGPGIIPLGNNYLEPGPVPAPGGLPLTFTQLLSSGSLQSQEQWTMAAGIAVCLGTGRGTRRCQSFLLGLGGAF